MKQDLIYNELLEKISDIPVVDSHEHLMPEKMRLSEGTDFFSITMAQYASSDLISAGISEENIKKLRSTDGSVSFDDKIKLFMPYWNRTSNTAYCRALRIAANEIYGVNDINAETLPELNKKLLEKNKPGLYKEILQDRLHIKYCMWDQFWCKKPDKDNFFKISLRLDDIVFINDVNDIKKLEAEFKVNISTPTELEDLLEICITENKYRGLAAIKTALAYKRTLRYKRVSRIEASMAMDKLLKSRYSNKDVKILQDYMMYSLAEKAYWHDLPLQVHTGLLEGNGNIIYHADPSLLSELISANPHTCFNIFHGGYPYGGQLSAMAKMFPNVYIDMSWLHIISPEYTKRYLSEWLEAVPVCKIIGFGGDYVFIEGVYGHLRIAQDNVASVLADKVNNGIYSMDEALRYARLIFCENADSLFSK